eukprot:NODE_663_length_4918_cov_0.396140.p1 type:complete len:360 gc:universal NODE_663_length_4918_cov_0.396140:2694-3773(+)
MKFLNKFKKKDVPHIKYPIHAIKKSPTNAPIYYQEGDQFMVLDDKKEKYKVYDPKSKQILEVDKEHFTLNIRQQTHPKFGVCLFEFEGHEADELSMKEDEQFILMSKVNDEWYYGKAINRVASGIIPVSFVEVRDAKTGKLIPKDELDDLPNMEDYMQFSQRLKEKSIPLFGLRSPYLNIPEKPLMRRQLSDGLIKRGKPTVNKMVRQSSDSEYNDKDDTISITEDEELDRGRIINLNCVSSIITPDLKTAFTLFCTRESGAYTLYRTQAEIIALHEALKKSEQTTMLPDIPKTINFWTKEAVEKRIIEFDDYFRAIVNLPVVDSQNLKSFLNPKANDKLGGLYRDPSDIELSRRRSSM